MRVFSKWRALEHVELRTRERLKPLSDRQGLLHLGLLLQVFGIPIPGVRHLPHLLVGYEHQLGEAGDPTTRRLDIPLRLHHPLARVPREPCQSPPGCLSLVRLWRRQHHRSDLLVDLLRHGLLSCILLPLGGSLCSQGLGSLTLHRLERLDRGALALLGRLPLSQLLLHQGGILQRIKWRGPRPIHAHRPGGQRLDGQLLLNH